MITIKNKTITQILLIIIIIILVTMCSKMNAQLLYSTNAVYLTHQPVDFGVGIRGDYAIRAMGLYSSVSYGNGGLYKANDLKHHIKITSGILIPLQDYHGASYDISAGINYHNINSKTMDESFLNPDIYNHWSFELGLTVKLNKFCLGIRTDLLRCEPAVDIGTPLNQPFSSKTK